MLMIKDKLPEFSLESSLGGVLSDGDLLGRYSLVVFYPKNNTPGWDKQLALLEEAREGFEKLDTQVLGINPASVDSHKKYAEKKGFNFPLLADVDYLAVKGFECVKSERGGLLRTVYAFDPKGVLIFGERGHASYDKIMEVIKAGE